VMYSAVLKLAMPANSATQGIGSPTGDLKSTHTQSKTCGKRSPGILETWTCIQSEQGQPNSRQALYIQRVTIISCTDSNAISRS
jgi:hypothetical protein